MSSKVEKICRQRKGAEVRSLPGWWIDREGLKGLVELGCSEPEESSSRCGRDRDGSSLLAVRF